MSAGRLAEVLAAHQRIDRYDTIGCTCGMRASGASTWPNPVRVRHHAEHLATVVADWLRSDEVLEAVARAFWPQGPGKIGWYGAQVRADAALAAIRDHLTGDDR